MQLLRRVLLGLMVGIACPLHCFGQSTIYPPPPQPAQYPEAQLEQLVAPIALYPDTLLASVLTASTHPLEVVLAQRWLEGNPGLTGDALSSAIDTQPWDASVKEVIAYPSVLAMMNDQLDWTQSLGDAFLQSQAEVLDAVQRLRQRAQGLGNLQSNAQQEVVADGQNIAIDNSDPGVSYVPYYDSNLVYGYWSSYQYRPWTWTPPLIFSPSIFYSTGISFGAAVVVKNPHAKGPHCDWGHRRVLADHDSDRPNRVVATHQPDQRLGIAYHAALTRTLASPAGFPRPGPAPVMVAQPMPSLRTTSVPVPWAQPHREVQPSGGIPHSAGSPRSSPEMRTPAAAPARGMSQAHSG